MKVVQYIFFLTFCFKFVDLNRETLLENFPLDIFIDKGDIESEEYQQKIKNDTSQIIQFLTSRKIIRSEHKEEDEQASKGQIWEQEAFIFTFLILKKLLSVNTLLIDMGGLKNQFKERKNYAHAYQNFEFKLEMMHTFDNPTKNKYMQKLNVSQINESQFKDFDQPQDIPQKDQKLDNIQPQNYQLIKKKLFIQNDPFKNLNYFELLTTDQHNEFLNKIQNYLNQQSQPEGGDRYSNYQQGLMFLKYNAVKQLFLRHSITHRVKFETQIPTEQDQRNLNLFLHLELNIDQMIQCLIDKRFLINQITQNLIQQRIELFNQQKIERLFYKVEDYYAIQVLVYRIRSQIIEFLYSDISIEDDIAQVTGDEFFDDKSFLNAIQEGQEVEQHHIQIPQMTTNVTQDHQIKCRSQVYYQEILLFAQQIIRQIFCNNDPEFRLISCFIQQNHFESNSKCPKPIQNYVKFLALYKEDVSFPILINTINLYPYDDLNEVENSVNIFVDYLFVYLRDVQITKELDHQFEEEKALVNDLLSGNRLLRKQFIVAQEKNMHKLSVDEKKNLNILQQQYDKSKSEIFEFIQEIVQKQGRKLDQQDIKNILMNEDDDRILKNKIFKNSKLI